MPRSPEIRPFVQTEAVLDENIEDNKDMYHPTLYPGSLRKLPHLKMELISDTRPVRVKLRNYT